MGFLFERRMPDNIVIEDICKFRDGKITQKEIDKRIIEWKKRDSEIKGARDV